MMAVAGVFMNALVLLPAYAVAFGAPIESFIEMELLLIRLLTVSGLL